MITSLKKESTTHILCNSTISFSSSIVWRKIGNELNGKVPIMTSSLDSNDADEVCQAYGKDINVLSLITDNTIIHTPDGIVRKQSIALIVCKSTSTSAGIYECVAESISGDVEVGPQIKIGMSDASSLLSKMPYIYGIIGSASIAVLFLLIITVLCSCLRAKRKQTKADFTVTDCKAKENTYYELPLKRK